MGLYDKIYNVMNDSKALEKKMNVGGQYKAISEAAVLNEIKPLLKKHKLILFPVSAEIKQDGKLSQISATYKIVDIETGESEMLATVGNGADTQDKGSGKAWTYAYKALIQKTFCLFSGEDTDNTHSDDIVKPTGVSCTDLIEIGYKSGLKAGQIEKVAIHDFGHGLEFISQDEHDELLKRLEAKAKEAVND